MKHYSLEDRASAIPLSKLVVSALLLAAAFGWIPPASAEEATDSGEVYVGDGCVRAGDVVVGDCESGDGVGEEATSSPDAATPEGGSSEDTVILEATLRQETTGFEATSPEDTVPRGSIPEEHAACPTEPSGETREATVERAVDGDTLEISEEITGADRVRLIGVDSPEMNATEDAEPEPGAAEAARFTAAALTGEDVVLELGEDSKDDHGRLLAHVWTGAEAGKEEGFWSGLKSMVGMGEAAPELFNEALLEEGRARTLAIEPNDVYAECFEAAERRAESGGGAEVQYGGQTVSEQTSIERTAPETTTSEASPEEQYEGPEDPERQAPGETAPEEGTVPAGEQYEEPTAPEETVPELTEAERERSGGETIGEEAPEETAEAPEPSTTEEEAAAPELTIPEEASEETTFVPEALTEAGQAPASSVTPEPETSPEVEAGEPQGSRGEPVEEPPAYVEATVEPPEEIAESPALDTLPAAQTPEGSVPVLPDTGGVFALLVLASTLGAACLVVGVCRLALLAALRRRSRGPERR